LAGTVTIIDVDEDGNVTKVPMDERRAVIAKKHAAETLAKQHQIT